MSSVLSVCPVRGCGALTSGGRCPSCLRADNDRRHAKQKAQGRDALRWRRLVVEAKERDGYACVDCGATADLTVHLDPKLEGRHDIATIEDCVTVCRPCHGRRDAPRSFNGGHAPAPLLALPPRANIARETSTTVAS